MPIATPRRSSYHSSSASGVASMVAIPRSSQVAMIQATCSADLDRKCRKLVPNPAWTRLIISRFGNSAERMPCSECAPSLHRSLMRIPPLPSGSKPSRCSRSVVTSKPDANTMTSTGYSTPQATTPFSVISSTPCPSVSTRWTLGRLNAGRYSSWKHTRLQCLPYQGWSLAAVSGSSTMRVTR